MATESLGSDVRFGEGETWLHVQVVPLSGERMVAVLMAYDWVGVRVCETGHIKLLPMDAKTLLEVFATREGAVVEGSGVSIPLYRLEG